MHIRPVPRLQPRPPRGATRSPRAKKRKDYASRALPSQIALQASVWKRQSSVTSSNHTNNLCAASGQHRVMLADRSHTDCYCCCCCCCCCCCGCCCCCCTAVSSAPSCSSMAVKAGRALGSSSQQAAMRAAKAGGQWGGGGRRWPCTPTANMICEAQGWTIVQVLCCGLFSCCGLCCGLLIVCMRPPALGGPVLPTAAPQWPSPTGTRQTRTGRPSQTWCAPQTALAPVWHMGAKGWVGMVAGTHALVHPLLLVVHPSN